MTRLVQVRDELKPFARERGLKLTYMPFMIKAASLALSQYPILNSSLDVANESLHYKSAHNISVAIDSPDGLVVPNVKNCQCKSVFQITGELAELQAKAQKGQLRPEDFANGTFSLSNIGVVSIWLEASVWGLYVCIIHNDTIVDWRHIYSSLYHATTSFNRSRWQN